jgi:phosphate transport system permease protein
MTSTALSPEALPYDPTAPLTASGNLRRRMIVSRLAQGGMVVAAAIAVLALGLVTFEVIREGEGVINLTFFTQDPPSFGPGGGIRSAILGTAFIVTMAAVIATPLGVLIAILLVEFAGPGSRLGAALRMGLDLLQGIPTIVVGLFIFGLIVETQNTESGFAGSVALAIIMLPLIARSTQEVLQVVPNSLREASDALGVQRWRSIVTVVLPSALSGIVTGVVLAVARAAGETAPLLVVDSTFSPHVTFNWFGPMPNIPVSILTTAEAADPSAFPRAWGQALVLLGLILIANIGARVLLARSRRKVMG